MKTNELVLYKKLSISKKKLFLFGKWLLAEKTQKNFYIVPSNSKNTVPIEVGAYAVNKLALKLTAYLSKGLNKIFLKNESSIYWKTILYPWAWYYSNHIICLKRRCKTILKLNKKLNCQVENFSYYNKITPPSFNEFITLTGSEYWNAAIIKNIFQSLERGKNKKQINFKFLNNKKKLIKYYPDKVYNSFRQKSIKFFFSFLNLLPTRNNQPLIISSFLPTMQEALLKISFYSFPKIFTSPKIIHKKPNTKLRKKLTSILMKNKNLSFNELIAINNLQNCLPTAYLEDHNSILIETDKINWPIKPKFIFTSNNHIWDDFFKTWSAKKRSLGCPYFVGQHGANYGTNKSSIYYPDEIIADRLFTWGWKLRNNFHVPAFIFKT